MSNDLQADLTADLLRDLSLPARPPTAAPVAPTAAATTPARSGTPALSVALTPLRWSGPSLRRTGGGTGVVVRLGPWRVELGL